MEMGGRVVAGRRCERWRDAGALQGGWRRGRKRKCEKSCSTRWTIGLEYGTSEGGIWRTWKMALRVPGGWKAVARGGVSSTYSNEMRVIRGLAHARI